MNIDLATSLLENLLERARKSPESVFLTSKEIDALAIILGRDDLEEKPLNNTHNIIPFNFSKSDVFPDAILCIDFGTSFSKAFITLTSKNGSVQPVALKLGDEGPGLTTPSEVFIESDRIYFGPAARRRWNDIQAPSERLIDSIKQFITLNQEVSKLSDREMPVAQDPKQQFSQRDILILYLSHLMSLVERAIEKKGYSPNIKRRFTHPAWKSTIREQNEKEMRRLMAEAVVLARSAPTEFAGSMSVIAARAFLDQLRSLDLDHLPTDLIGEPVREATAAGAGALLATREGKREAYLVLDIGAGTTDVAGFYCTNNPDNELIRVFEVTTAVNAKNIAGNVLDGALQGLIIQKSGLVASSTEGRLASVNLRRQIRSLKELLFQTGRIIVDLTTDQIVEVGLDEFLRYQPVVEFNKQIKAMVAESAVALAGDNRRIKLVATGGGARLPVVSELAEKGVRLNDTFVGLELVEAMPDTVREEHPDWTDPYPQIAVALGGSLPYLPEQRVSIEAGLTQAPRRVMSPNYKS